MNHQEALHKLLITSKLKFGLKPPVNTLKSYVEWYKIK